MKNTSQHYASMWCVILNVLFLYRILFFFLLLCSLGICYTCFHRTDKVNFETAVFISGPSYTFIVLWVPVCGFIATNRDPSLCSLSSLVVEEVTTFSCYICVFACLDRCRA